MLKKTLVLLTVVVLLAGLMVFPASAATVSPWYYDYEDWIVGDPEIVTLNNAPYYQMIVRLPTSALSLRLRHDTAQKKVVYGTNDGYPLELSYTMPSNPYYCQLVAGVSVEDLFWGENILGEVAMTATFGVETKAGCTVIESYMSSTNYSIDGTSRGTLTGPVDSDATLNGVVSGQMNITGDFGTTMNLCVVFNAGGGDWKFYLYDLYFTFWIPCEFRDEWHSENLANVTAKQNMLLKNQEILIDDMTTQQEITNEKLDELPGQIGDEYQGIIDKENQAANDAGDSAAGELMDIIPNESQGFMDAIQSLVDSMSYTGTEAKLPVPAIYIPAIPGVMDRIQLTDELSVDFGYWVQKLPGGVLELVQILGTIALIVYCFKELYGMIAYAMTLKGGGSGE